MTTTFHIHDLGDERGGFGHPNILVRIGDRRLEFIRREPMATVPEFVWEVEEWRDGKPHISRHVLPASKRKAVAAFIEGGF